jgi:hypothetical protein
MTLSFSVLEKLIIEFRHMDGGVFVVSDANARQMNLGNATEEIQKTIEETPRISIKLFRSWFSLSSMRWTCAISSH